MLNDDICKLRDELNKSIEKGEDYSIIYQLSIDLDKLIAEYYKELRDNKNKFMCRITQKRSPLNIYMFKGFLLDKTTCILLKNDI